MVRSSEMRACSMYALDALERLSQTKRIEASLMAMDLRHAGLRVEMLEKGGAQVSGVLYRHEDKGASRRSSAGSPGLTRYKWT
jgi:hypothetical protein